MPGNVGNSQIRNERICQRCTIVEGGVLLPLGNPLSTPSTWQGVVVSLSSSTRLVAKASHERQIIPHLVLRVTRRLCPAVPAHGYTNEVPLIFCSRLVLVSTYPTTLVQHNAFIPVSTFVTGCATPDVLLPSATSLYSRGRHLATP